MRQAPLLQPEGQCGPQHAEAVYHAAPEVDRRSLWLIPGRTGDFADCEVEIVSRRDDLVIEHEVVGEIEDRKRLERASAPGAEARMVFGKLLIDHNILNKRKGAVEDIFVPGHSALERALT